MLILAVDDDWDDLQLFFEAVVDIDPSITMMVAQDGQEAIDLLTKKDCVVPDCIFLDINMPRMNGRQCLDKLRSIEYLKATNVIMYSTSISKNDADFFTKRGANFLKKATDYKTLKKSIASILATLRPERSN
jgi:CheY-like chemotaxis protein